MNWHGSGYEEAEEVRRQQQEEREAQDKGRRLWIDHKVGDNPNRPRNETTVIFLGGVADENGIPTSEPFTWWEHNPKIDGSFREHYTCTRSMGGCRFCDADPDGRGMKRYFAGGYTVIDCASWTANSGKLVQNQKKLLVAKSDMIAVFKKKAEVRGSLIGTKWHVFRSGEKKAAIGDQWEFIETVKIDDHGVVLDSRGDPLQDGEGKIVNDQLIDYIDVLQPLDDEKAKAVVARWRPGSRESQGNRESPGSGRSGGGDQNRGGHGTRVDYRK